MNLLDFYRQYPDEASCEEALRRFREHEMQLRSGTVMQGSHLPVRDWFAAMFLLTATKRAISTKEIQRQIGPSVTSPYGRWCISCAT